MSLVPVLIVFPLGVLSSIWATMPKRNYHSSFRFNNQTPRSSIILSLLPNNAFWFSGFDIDQTQIVYIGDLYVRSFPYLCICNILCDHISFLHKFRIVSEWTTRLIANCVFIFHEKIINTMHMSNIRYGNDYCNDIILCNTKWLRCLIFVTIIIKQSWEWSVHFMLCK